MTRGRPTTRYVALIRAINVPGHHSLKMDDVRATFAAGGYANVRTCLQSGNVIFDADRASRTAICEKIRRLFFSRFGAEPEFVLRTSGEMERLVNSEPFKGIAAAGPRLKLYVAFLLRKPPGKLRLPIESSKEALTAVSMANDHVFLVSRLKPNNFFGFPNNFIEDALGVPATTRNWSTVMKIAALVRSGPESAIIQS